ncbi:hypothetical protein [Luteimonas deserti]|uniref:Uncharacterized protein n=1 Tax=Luteimonas deserti TaxID=2752306 RepID=A0A7Z0QRX7_9GAMM|nr:hypothetical protein [Luteimonas deserti]NYZ63747.1 hypothetical protein [Luteimonas deserti]
MQRAPLFDAGSRLQTTLDLSDLTGQARRADFWGANAVRDPCVAGRAGRIGTRGAV